jgi:hypothetical protein
MNIIEDIKYVFSYYNMYVVLSNNTIDPTYQCYYTVDEYELEIGNTYVDLSTKTWTGTGEGIFTDLINLDFYHIILSKRIE